MKRSQADRAVVAARATRSTPDLARARMAPTTHEHKPYYGTGIVHRTRAGKMTKAQVSGNPGSPNLWSASQDCKDMVALDSRWGQTTRNRNV